MTNKELLKKVNELKNGSFFRITYRVNLTPLKDYKDTDVYKVVTVTARTGVKYRNLKAYVEPKNDTNNYKHYSQWIVSNKVKANIEDPDKLYFVIATMRNGMNRKTTYYKNGEITTKDVLDICRKTNNKSNILPAVQTIKAENIISIN